MKNNMHNCWMRKINQMSFVNTKIILENKDVLDIYDIKNNLRNYLIVKYG